MKANLPLSVDNFLIQPAKDYASDKGTSLSALVEDFFKSLIASKEKQKDLLEAFHQKHLKEGFVEPEDHEIDSLRLKMTE